MTRKILKGEFTEIEKSYYVQMLENVPPKRFHKPYRDGGWYIVGEAYIHDSDMRAWHHLCFMHDGKCYWGLRPIDISEEDILKEIREFVRNK